MRRPLAIITQLMLRRFIGDDDLASPYDAADPADAPVTLGGIDQAILDSFSPACSGDRNPVAPDADAPIRDGDSMIPGADALMIPYADASLTPGGDALIIPTDDALPIPSDDAPAIPDAVTPVILDAGRPLVGTLLKVSSISVSGLVLVVT